MATGLCRDHLALRGGALRSADGQDRAEDRILPDGCFFQMDVLWTVLPGQDPARLLEKYPDRWLLIALEGSEEGSTTGEFDRQHGFDQRRGLGFGAGEMGSPAEGGSEERHQILFHRGRISHVGGADPAEPAVSGIPGVVAQP